MTSDQFLFPIVQASILMLLLVCWWMGRNMNRHRDGAAVRDGAGVEAEVIRGPMSMAWFGAAFGFGALIVTQVNQSVFAHNPFWARHSVLINLLDLAVLAYACFWNIWSRNKIVELFSAGAKRETRRE